MYKVIKEFCDRHTKVIYAVGDTFPHNGVSAERIAELASGENLLGVPLIVEVKSKQTRKKKTEE